MTDLTRTPVDPSGVAAGGLNLAGGCLEVDPVARDALAAALDPEAFEPHRGLTKLWEVEIRRHCALLMADRAWLAGYRLVGS